tara:strand:- start:167 stop:1522 length:1356 start_codon:yes stop_codon:yes gene_type:complete
MILTKTLQFTEEIQDDPEIFKFLYNLTPKEATIMVISYYHGMLKSKDKQTDLLNHDQINERVEENTRERTVCLEDELKEIKKKYEKIELKNESLEEKNNLLNNEIMSSKKEAKEEQKEMDQEMIETLKEDKNILQKQNYSLQDKIEGLTVSVQSLTNTNNNSQKKGKVGEDLTEKKIIPPGWEYENKANESHQGDGHLWNPHSQYKLLIDYKNYTQKIPKGETLKLIKDVNDNHMRAGVMVSLTSGISHHTKSMERNSIELEMIENTPYLFISYANDLTDGILQSLMITLDCFISEISGDKENLVELRVLLLQQSVNMLNLSLDKMKSQRKTILTMEKSFRIGVNNLRNDIDSAENEIKRIIYNLNGVNNSNDNIESSEEVNLSTQTTDEVQEVVEELIDSVTIQSNLISQELLSEMTCPELREMCKEKGIKGISKSTKDILIEKLVSYNE